MRFLRVKAGPPYHRGTCLLCRRGGVFFLAFKFDGRTAAIVARAALVCMAMYNALQAREIAAPAA